MLLGLTCSVSPLQHVCSASQSTGSSVTVTLLREAGFQTPFQGAQPPTPAKRVEYLRCFLPD